MHNSLGSSGASDRVYGYGARYERVYQYGVRFERH